MSFITSFAAPFATRTLDLFVVALIFTALT
jgi:hypothetical protein